MTINYIGADVDSKMTNFAVERCGKIVKEFCVPTTLAAWRTVFESVPGHKKLAIEEGTMAGWLYRNLKDTVDEFMICDPRRNGLIYDDGDKTDVLDARKLAQLLRGGYLRSIYHSDNEERVLFKNWVSLYHDRIRDAVRQGHKLRDRCRLYGVRLCRSVRESPERRRDWLAGQTADLRDQLEVLLIGYEAVRKQVRKARSQVAKFSRRYSIISYWEKLPGVGPIRAATFFVYMDTAFRFGGPKKVWKYCGVGLQVASSGKDRYGKPKKGRQQLAWAVNRRLKDVAMGMAESAINQRRNVFYSYYERMVKNGLMPSNAKHQVARKMLSVMWGMWKNNGRFDEKLVFDKSLI